MNISYKYDNIIYLEQIYHQGDLKKQQPIRRDSPFCPFCRIFLFSSEAAVESSG